MNDIMAHEWLVTMAINISDFEIIGIVMMSAIKGNGGQPTLASSDGCARSHG